MRIFLQNSFSSLLKILLPFYLWWKNVKEEGGKIWITKSGSFKLFCLEEGKEILENLHEVSATICLYFWKVQIFSERFVTPLLFNKYCWELYLENVSCICKIKNTIFFSNKHSMWTRHGCLIALYKLDASAHLWLCQSTSTNPTLSIMGGGFIRDITEDRRHLCFPFAH